MDPEGPSAPGRLPLRPASGAWRVTHAESGVLRPCLPVNLWLPVLEAAGSTWACLYSLEGHRPCNPSKLLPIWVSPLTTRPETASPQLFFQSDLFCHPFQPTCVPKLVVRHPGHSHRCAAAPARLLFQPLRSRRRRPIAASPLDTTHLEAIVGTSPSCQPCSPRHRCFAKAHIPLRIAPHRTGTALHRTVPYRLTAIHLDLSRPVQRDPCDREAHRLGLSSGSLCLCRALVVIATPLRLYSRLPASHTEPYGPLGPVATCWRCGPVN